MTGTKCLKEAWCKEHTKQVKAVVSVVLTVTMNNPKEHAL